MQKADLINLVIVRSPGTPEQLKKLRQQLSWKTIAELGQIVDEQNVQIRAEAVPAPSPRVAGGGLHRIFQIPINGKVAVRNEAAERIIEGWVDEIRGDVLSPEWFIQVLKETPQLANQLQWQSADVLDPKKRRAAEAAQDRADHEVFEETAKRSGLYAINEANWNVLHSVLGSGLNETLIRHAVESGQVGLTPATPQALAEWAQGDAEQRQAWLVDQASPEQLREAARQEAEERRIQAQQEFVRKQEQAAREREAASGKGQLPEFNQVTGEKLDSTFFNKLSVVNREEFRRWVTRYGGQTIIDRMRGIR